MADIGHQKTVTCDGKQLTVRYQTMKRGDLVYTFDHEHTYTADIMDADELGWVIIKEE